MLRVGVLSTFVRIRWFEELTNVRPLTWNRSWTPQRGGLVYFPTLFGHCNSGLRHVVIPFSVLIDEHWIHGFEEHRMPPFPDISHPGSFLIKS